MHANVIIILQNKKNEEKISRGNRRKKPHIYKMQRKRSPVIARQCRMPIRLCSVADPVDSLEKFGDDRCRRVTMKNAEGAMR